MSSHTDMHPAAKEAHTATMPKIGGAGLAADISTAKMKYPRYIIKSSNCAILVMLN
jgi:hypothetical protein